MYISHISSYSAKWVTRKRWYSVASIEAIFDLLEGIWGYGPSRSAPLHHSLGLVENAVMDGVHEFVQIRIRHCCPGVKNCSSLQVLDIVELSSPSLTFLASQPNFHGAPVATPSWPANTRARERARARESTSVIESTTVIVLVEIAKFCNSTAMHLLFPTCCPSQLGAFRLLSFCEKKMALALTPGEA